MVVRRKSDNIDKWIGLSTDSKPDSDIGSLFIEEDTDTVYVKVVGEWVEFGGGGGGGSPFSEPIHVIPNGTIEAPAITFGDLNEGFLTPAGFYVSSDGYYIHASLGVGYPLAAIGPYGITLSNDLGITWLNVNDLDDVDSSTSSVSLTNFDDNEVHVYAFDLVGYIPAKFSLLSEYSGGAVWNKLVFITQAAPDDYIITPVAASTAVRGLQLGHTGGRLGFNGTVAVAKPTVSGAKGSNAALASLLTALAAYGLIVDGSGA